MRALYRSVLVFFILLTLDSQRHRRVVVRSASTSDIQPDSITYILKSYADAFTTTSTTSPTKSETTKSEPTKLQLFPFTVSATTPSVFTEITESSNNVYSYPPAKPIITTSTTTGYFTPVPPPKELTLAGSKNVQSNLAYDEDEELGEHQEPPDHVIPYSEHEDPPEPATRPNYTAPGAWAKPSADKNISLDFVPTKLYAQVRGTHTVQHVPRDEAIKSAETDEEKANAARLKEVVKISKANTVYSEEGYEDAAYDHAGQIRDADFHEGFARKLNDHIDLNGTDDSPHRKRPPHGKRPRYGKRPKRPRNRRPRKSKSRSFDDYRDHAEEEARTHQKQVDPDDLKVLKSALNQSNLDPKNFALDGIRELERDLKKESEEIQRTSTEPYSSTTSLVPPIQPRSISRTDNYDYTTLPVEVDSISKSDRAETTTPKRDVFTVRPKKLTTPWPSIYVRKIKKPVNYYGTSSKNQNQNYNSIPGNSYDDKPPTTTTTESYENLLRQYVLNNPNLTPTVTYRPVSSASSNPLALATVNGHGPYLVVVTNSPNAMPSSSYEPLLSQPTSQYFTISHENRSNLATLSSQSDTGYERKNLRGKQASIRSGDADSFDDDEDAEEKEKPKDADELEFANFDPLPDEENEEKPGKPSLEKDMDQFTFMQPPKALDPFFADYPRQRDPGQWSVTRSKEELVESAYAVVEDDADAPKSLRPQKRVILPVTRLLPPSPLSTSEYTSFQMRDRRSEILPPTVMAIIEAIHKSEAQKTSSFPFLFRRKRSALGPTREWEIEQRDKKLQAAGKAKEVGFSRRNGKKGSGRPADFKYLLNESPKIALGVVDEEIAERFKEGSKEGSSEASTSSSDSDESHANFKAANKKPNGKGSTTVEVSLPELDFSNNYDEEEEEEEVDPAALSEAQTVDRQKYPYYQNSAVLSTALEYVINPSLIPRKTVGGMEFYDSRRLECDEIEPNLEKIVPEEEELKNKRGARKGKLRLQGLGDKLDCFKAKFFDQNPLDNPLFIEKEVKLPPLPDELDPKKFASRISKFPPEKDDYVVQKGPKNPENYDSRSRKQKIMRNGAKQYYNTRPNYDASPTYVPPPSRDGPKNQKNRRPAGFSNSGRYIPEDSAETKPQPKPKIKKKRKKLNKNILPFESSDQAEVYEDVMGNIMRLEKIRRHPSSKYGFTPAPRLRHRDKGSHAGNNKNRQQAEIDGMIPPPPKQHVNNNNNQYKNKYRYPNERERYYDSNESTYPVVSSRVYKRSIDESKNDEQQLPEENTGKKAGNETAMHKIKYSTPNSISFTIDHRVPPSKINALAVGSVPTLESIQKHTNRSTQDTGRYDKFNDNKDETTSIDSRRNEPRYNVPNKKHISNPSNETLNTTNGNKTVIESSEDLSDFGSTFVPVIVKPDESTINKLLKENKEQIENAENKTKETEEYSSDKDADVKKIDKLKNSKKRYSDDPVANAYALDPSIKEHKELNDFLEGEPPGYDKAFGPEAKYEASSPPKQDSLHKEESKVRRSYRQKDHSGEEEGSKEDLSKSAEESSKETNSAEASSAENEESKEVAQTNQNDKKNSSESKDEPFERYSERPYSPPENYEDDKYSDLGPRINKPYFYHPPFEIPDYERDKYNKNKDPSDLHTSEESEDHETYVYPWEKDDNQNNDSKDHDYAGNYEYPWEKREKNKKDGSQEKYDATEENSEEATNTEPIYIPLNGKHVRGKKDVNKEEANPGNGTLPKYTSKYKIKPKYGSSKDGPTTESYLKDSLVSRPTVKTRTTHRSITNDTYIISTDADSVGNDSDSSNKTENSNETSTLKPASSLTTSTTLIDPRYMQRRNKDIMSRRSFSHATHVESTTPMLTRRRRGRVRNSTDSTPASTISSPYQNGRRRGRPAGIVASGSSLVATTTNDRRRRPFRVQSDSTPTSTVRTIAHHSRVSKQEIITKTTYPDEDDEEDSITEENSPRRSRSRKTTLTSGSNSSSSSPIELAKIRRGGRRPKNDLEQGELGAESGDNDRPSKKKKVEKVVITMEETPDHVYETKEVDRDGVKGKFVTITANNNSDSSKNHHANGEDDDLHMQDAEIEEMNRRRSADNSFHSLMRDTEDLLDKSSGVEDYMVGDMLQKSPLPVTRKDSKTPKNGTEEYEGENDDDEHDEEEEDDDEVDDYEDHNDDDDEENEEEDNEDEAEDDNAADKIDKTDKDKDAEKKELEDQRTLRGNSTTRKAKPDDKDKEGIKNYPLKKKLEDKPVNRGSIRMATTKPTDKPVVNDEIKKNDGKTTPRRRDIIISINDDGIGRENKTSNIRRRKPTVEESTKTPIKRSTAQYDEDEIKNTTSTETTIPAGVVKDPSIRKYFYVETD